MNRDKIPGLFIGKGGQVLSPAGAVETAAVAFRPIMVREAFLEQLVDFLGGTRRENPAEGNGIIGYLAYPEAFQAETQLFHDKMV